MTPESVHDRLVAFLTANPGLDFCDACLAAELHVRQRLAGIAADWLRFSARFHRGIWLCSRCGLERPVIRARSNGREKPPITHAIDASRPRRPRRRRAA